MLRHKTSLLAFLWLVTYGGPAIAEAASPFGDMFMEEVAKNAESACANFENLPTEVCQALFDQDELKEKLNDPQILNSALARVWSDNPLNLKFKVFDVQGGDSSLGLSYSKEFKIRRVPLDGTDAWNQRLNLDLQLDGNVAFEEDVNPQNFLRTKLAFSSAWSTNISGIPAARGLAAQKLNTVTAQCLSEDDPDLTAECRQAYQDVQTIFDDTLGKIGGFKYYALGLDVGYESDQAFEVTQTTFGAFGYAQMESWGSTGFLGKWSIFPAIRIGVDLVSPESDTPRALAGDSSDFYRFSGEASIVMPVGTFNDMPLQFTANYRSYVELSASQIVKDAGLDNFDLVTLSLSGPSGIYVSYSRGKLPLDVDRSNVVELGIKLNMF